NAFLFESTEGTGRLARFSFLGVDPLLTISIADGTATWTLPDKKVVDAPASDPVELLRQTLTQYAPVEGRAVPTELSEIPFLGGLVGYMGYGSNRYFENIPQQSIDPFSVPDAHYGLYDSVFVFDHQYRRVSVISLRGLEHAQSLMECALAPS